MGKMSRVGRGEGEGPLRVQVIATMGSAGPSHGQLLTLCICTMQGQETRKVTDLAEAMRDAGLDPDEVTGPIEDEYAAMDLP